MKKIKAVVYDSDGMLTHGERFSTRYCNEFNFDYSVMEPFFNGPFKKCLVGKADLKEELRKALAVWDWDKSVEELMDYWFDSGDELDSDAYGSIYKLKERGLVCCLATNQEKYRTQYLVDRFDYDKIFDEVVSSAHIGYPKTSTEGLRATVEALKKHADIEKEHIVYWDDDDDNVADLRREGFNGQKYVGFEDFKKKMKELGYEV